MSRVVRVKYEGGVLKPLDPIELEEGEEIKVRIEKSLREMSKELIGALGESSEEELEE